MTLNTICGELLKELFGDDILEDDNFKDTPKRMAVMYTSMFKPTELIDEMVGAVMSKSFPTEYDGIVMLPNIESISFCPHHMLPVTYTITIAYIPGKEHTVIGASKPERIARLWGKHPYLQETFTKKIADTISSSIHPSGLAVVVKGRHSCMRIRGVNNPCAEMITSEMFGAFKENPETRAEFHALLADSKRG